MTSIRLVAGVALAAVALAGCGDDDERAMSAPAGTGSVPVECEPPNRLVGDACREPGVQDDGCPAGTLGLDDGTCRPAGIVPEMCGEGFAHDGDVGCEPILPAEPCPPGRMAVPGDAECHAVMPCPSGKWGDIPIDATTQHVDASYAGADSDGSAAKPWTTIGAAIAAAAASAIVAVAAGSYVEDVIIPNEPVVLWGVCPDDVEIVGTVDAAIVVGSSATVVRGVALTGGAVGIFVSGAEDVVLDHVRVHDNAGRGVNVQETFGPTSITVVESLIEDNEGTGVYVSGSTATLEATVVRGTKNVGGPGRGIAVQGGVDSGDASVVAVERSLVEKNRDHGVFVDGSDLTIDSSVLRGTEPDGAGLFGRGVGAQLGPGKKVSTLAVKRSYIVDNHDIAFFASGSDASIEATVVRSTLPDASGFGRGIGVQNVASRPAVLGVRSCVIDQNHEIGVFASGSDATIEATVVRGTHPDAQGGSRGISAQHDPLVGMRSTLRVEGAVVEQSREVGIYVAGYDASLDATIVRGTLPDDAGRHGRGIVVQDDPDSGGASKAGVQASVVDHNREIGVFVGGSEATIEASVVRDTTPDAMGLGHGITIAYNPVTGARATVAIKSSLVEQSHEFGVVLFSSDATVERCLVEGTLAAADGRFGDGISAILYDGPATLVVDASRIVDSARAGISSFGAAVSLGHTAIQCAVFELEGEQSSGAPFSFEDLGGNTCGCPSPDSECLLVSAGLEPPALVPVIE